MNSHHCRLFNICFLLIIIDFVTAESRTQPKKVIAERGSDLSLPCTFQDEDTDKTIVQWLYQNVTDYRSGHKSHWRPLFHNTQSLTPSETRYSIQQKLQPINMTTITYLTILTLAKVTNADEGIYMCKSLSPKIVDMIYQVRVIESLDINPRQLSIPANEMGSHSIRLHCILTDNHSAKRNHEIHWWHNNKRLGSHNNRHARITKNVTQHSLVSTLFYTGASASVAGSYVCESELLRKYISVELQTNCSSIISVSSRSIWTIMWIFLLILACHHVD